MTRVRVNEGSVADVTGSVLDGSGDGVPGSSLTSAFLTLYDLDTATYDQGSPVSGIINSRERDDLLSPSPEEIYVDEDGAFTWTMTSADNPIVTSSRQVEIHRASFRFVWPTGEYRTEVQLEVVNQRMAV